MYLCQRLKGCCVKAAEIIPEEPGRVMLPRDRKSTSSKSNTGWDKHTPLARSAYTTNTFQEHPL